MIIRAPLTKPTVLGLDLRGGVELVYQGGPTPQVPKVTPQAIDDAIETIRKRTDALGVSEPEIQRAGHHQISIGLPDVDNADRADRAGRHDRPAPVLRLGAERHTRPSSGRTLRTPARRPVPTAGRGRRRRQKPQRRGDDIPPDGPSEEIEAALRRRQEEDPASTTTSATTPARRSTTSSTADKRADRRPRLDLRGAAVRLRGRRRPEARAERDPKDSVPEELAAIPVATPERATAERAQLAKTGPPGSQVLKVPQRHRRHRGRAPRRSQPDDVQQLLRPRGRLRAVRLGHQEPEAAPTSNTNAPIVTMSSPTRAARRSRASPSGSPSAARDHRAARHQPASRRFSASRSRSTTRSSRSRTIDFRENPEGIDGRTGAQINGIGDAPGHPGPGREPAHRRAADRAQADLADPGLRVARPAGARPGPARRRASASR